jgi:hypothetical protein
MVWHDPSPVVLYVALALACLLLHNNKCEQALIRILIRIFPLHTTQHHSTRHY